MVITTPLILSMFKPPNQNTKHKKKKKTVDPNHLRNQEIIIKQIKKTTRKPSRSRP